MDIATRPDAHLALVKLAAANRAQVICQKPMAETWEDCLAMVEHCRTANVRLLIHENWRWQPWYREVKKLIDAGDFGRIFHLGFCMRNGDLGFTSGAQGLIDANRISGAFPAEIAFGVFTLEGERAALRMTPQGDLFVTKYGMPEAPHPYDKPQHGYKGDSVFAAQRHYAECIRDGAQCETEGEEYLETVRAMFDCYESAETGRIIRLNA